MKLLCDVSGSMYRFNGYDGRLEREMEAMVMVMEGLEGYEHKIKVSALLLLFFCSCFCFSSFSSSSSAR